MKFSIAAATVLSMAAQVSALYKDPGTLFDYSAPLTGTEKCAVISLVMDESGSMSGEQGFMKDKAIPGIISELETQGFATYFCAYGYGSTVYHAGGGLQNGDAHFHGCAVGLDKTIMDYVVSGGFEDTFEAIYWSIRDLPASIGGKDLASSCKTMARNMIVVTDEDSDHSTTNSYTPIKTGNEAKSKGWVINIVANVQIKDSGTALIGAAPFGTSPTLYKQDGSSATSVSYTGTQKVEDMITSGYIDSEFDYPPIAELTDGAIWDLTKLRAGGTVAAAFTDAFIKGKVKEIIEIVTTTSPPVTTGSGPTTSMSGDPHVRLWNGQMFDFHGGCDLVMLSSPEFANGKGLDLHVRTQIKTWWSYIDTAVLRIGSDTFEVQGGLNTAKVWINGVEAALTETGYLRNKISGYNIHYKDVSKKQKKFRIEVGKENIAIETFNDFVRVSVKSENNSKNFSGSKGLMGEYPTGKMLDREGEVVEDTDEFGKEWQVRASEPKLFHATEGVQHPQECAMPVKSTARRLGENLISKEDASLACARVSPEDRDACIFDVLATNDKEMAGAY
jgi:hypothetical protein